MKIISPNSPTVKVLSPNKGGIYKNNVMISWEGADIDGDNLHYAVLVSYDNGVNWETLVTGLAEHYYLWNTSDAPPGGQYLVKVIATDGINTGDDIIDQFFTISSQKYLFMPRVQR